MKTRHFIGTLMVTFMVGMVTLPARGDQPSIDQQKNYYLQCINAEIDAYSCKVVHVNSRSKNLQTYGESAALRTAFLSQNKDALVQEMIAQKVSMRPHAVHQYLRQRFDQESLVQTAKVKP
jgi:hypothetical protein